ncbi:YbfB/YjiJ family MFS transporter [Saccharopolyspora elongata]|uniref:YbfB/YjiJ family MFS transporter n=2 Tax=Saccharopolyspora elongata TaxID=2530387 RepID=A0A4R4YBH2_9PSEU|nr:YbfB/YjiJ family MFS transporter [Saccharopolyspora elongata]
MLAVAVGVGRFVFTPILPLMQSQAGVSAQLGATLATANYAGYLAGALAAMVAPRLGRSALAVRISAVSVVASLALMPLTISPAVWIVLRGIAGAGGAVMFVAAATAVLTGVSHRSRHLVGWAYGGVGAGIALSGSVVLLVSLVGDWRIAWGAATVLAASLSVLGWNLIRLSRADAVENAGIARVERPHRWFVPLVLAYFLEGVGYIIAGTFLVAAVADAVPGPVGKATWIIVGLAAVPSCVLWAWLSSRMSHPTLLTAALGLQAAGIVLAGLGLGTVGAVIAAVLFGGTFMGVTTLALDAGRHLQVPAAVAILSAIYAIGQALGPVAVAPFLAGGFSTALYAAGGVVVLAAIGTILLRIRFPHTLSAIAPAPERQPVLHR